MNIRANDPVKQLREMREKLCFPVINRGKLWYERLSFEQIAELKKWYNDWLNVTDTKTIPIAPAWINEKLSEEEIII